MTARQFILLQTQRAAVTTILAQLGLPQNEFTWTEAVLDRVPMVADEGVVSRLVHAPTDFAFEFDVRSEILWASFSPGAERPNEHKSCRSWSEMLVLLREWGVNLKREIGAGGSPRAATTAGPTRPHTTNGVRIFLGHGSSRDWKDLKDFIQDRLGFEWEEFNREPAAGLSTKERLEAMLDSASFALLVLSAEDKYPDGTAHARENVVHELGLFQGRLGFERAIVLLEEGCSEFSNIRGVTQIRYPKGNIMAKSEEIRRVLEREGLVGSG